MSTPFSTGLAYDEEGRPLWVRDRRGKAAEMRYDEMGRLAWLNHGQTTCSGSNTSQSIGATTTWTYDDRDRIRSVTHRGPPPGAGIPGPVLLSRTYERNAAGEPDKITHEDGRTTEIDYDPAGRVEEERYFDAVGVLEETITYGYDLDGNRTSRTSNAGLEVYEYDTGSRLTRVTLDGVESQVFEYDENGRVTRIVRDGLDQRLTWDALDRLVRVQDVDAIQNPVDFAYDGQGRRVGRDGGAFQYVVGPTGNQSLESPHLVHNGFFLTGELVYNGEHALWRYDGNEPPETRIYLRDAMGSVIGLMDENGALVERFEYDAFGNVRGAGGEALPLSLGGDSRFQGMWKDTGTGLYYVRARYYDARTGRFLSRDPAEGQLKTPETFYPYVFANSNPYVFRDPSGENATLAEISAVSIVAAVLASTAYEGGQTVLRALRPRSASSHTPPSLRSIGLSLHVAVIAAQVKATLLLTDILLTENVADTGIVEEAERIIEQAWNEGRRLSVCEVLAQLEAEAKRIPDKKARKKKLQRIKATQKFYGCRHANLD